MLSNPPDALLEEEREKHRKFADALLEEREGFPESNCSPSVAPLPNATDYFLQIPVEETGGVLWIRPMRPTIHLKEFLKKTFVISSFCIEPFGTHIKVATCTNDEAYKRLLLAVNLEINEGHKEYEMKDSTRVSGFFYEQPTFLLIIFFGGSKETVVVHECAHVATFLCTLNEITIEAQHDEFFCSLLDFLYENVSEIHQEHLRLLNPKLETYILQT